jgi:small neutral amino acid transporter SnatA (MarC family)
MWEEFLSTTLVLFFVMDPIGNIPLFLNVLEKNPYRKTKMDYNKRNYFCYANFNIIFVHRRCNFKIS